jgi:hypothetical protein
MTLCCLEQRDVSTAVTESAIALQSPSLKLMPPCSAQQPKEDLIGKSKEAPIPTNEKPVLSYALDDNFAADELIEELKDKEQFGKRGEVVVLMQIVTCFLVMFPPMKLFGVVYFAGALLPFR